MDPTRAERIAERQAAVLKDLLARAQASVGNGLPLDSFLSDFYRRHPEFGSRDRRLFSGTVFAYFRWKGWIDAVTQDIGAACTIAHLLETVDIHPAISKLAAQSSMPFASSLPLGGLPLREKAAALERFCGTTLGLSQLAPSWLVPLIPDPDQYIEAMQTPPPTWLRVPPTMREQVLTALREQDSQAAPHPTVSSAISTSRGINLRAVRAPLRHCIQVQDLASQITGLVCAPNPGEHWWDACSGSGGKSLHLATLGGPSFSLLATDIRPSILDELARRASEANIRNIETSVWNGATQPPPADSFDGVLLDVPCSGTGTWHRNPDARWRMHESELTRLLSLQFELLKTCATRVKPGGILVYATCSITQAENESMVEQFLAAMPGVSLCPFSTPLNGQTCQGQLRIHPWDGPCNGMFIAKFIRPFRP